MPKFSMQTLEMQYLGALRSNDTIMATVYAAFIVKYSA